MSSRRELKDAVVEAARQWVRVFDDCGWTPGSKHTDLIAVVRALDACTEPDLDNAAVAEAVEEWQNGRCNFVAVLDVLHARRAALKPKPRYQVRSSSYIYDSALSRNLTVVETAALLNKEADK